MDDSRSISGTSVADDIIRAFDKMAGGRGTWEQHWREIARRVLPSHDMFNEAREPGEKRQQYIYDSTAVIALERFAAVLDSMLTPRSERWHGLTHPDQRMRDDIAFGRYFEHVNDILFAARYDNDANFASNMLQTYMQLGAFGTGAMMVEDDRRGGIRYRAWHLGEFYIGEDWQGRIDTIYRKYRMTARQAKQRFDKLPEKIEQCLEKEPEKQFDFIHCIMPNNERKSGRNDFRGMAFASYQVCLDTRSLMSEGGYRTWPVPVSRYVLAPREVYGRSVAMSALPDIKTLNQMSKTTIRAAQKAVDPALLLANDGLLASASTVPGALNFGGVDDQGRELVKPLNTGANLPLGLDMENQRRETINDAFLITLFQVLVDAPTMTATEVLERARQRGMLLAPTVGRQQGELLGPLIQRELDILAANGRIPPPPEDLMDGDDLIYEVEYDSPLNRSMESEKGAALMRTLEGLMPLAQFDPGALDRINVDEAAKLLAKVNGLPSKVIRSDDEVEEMRSQRAQATQMQQMIDGAPGVAGALKDLSEVA